MLLITLQPSAFVDEMHRGDDGELHELHRLPYPFYTDGDGMVQGQDFWRGSPLKVLGFQADAARQRVDLWWDDFLVRPQDAVGMWVVAVDDKGGLASYATSLETVTVKEVDE